MRRLRGGRLCLHFSRPNGAESIRMAARRFPASESACRSDRNTACLSACRGLRCCATASAVWGFRFAPDATRRSADDPWHAFADASFVLPRWTVFVREHESYVQLVIRPAELSAAERLLEELDRIEHAAQGSSGNPSPVCGGDFVQTEQPSQAEYCAMVAAALAGNSCGVLQKSFRREGYRSTLRLCFRFPRPWED